MRNNFLILVIMLLASFSLMASQEFDVSDGEKIQVKISKRELTRITISGGRINKMWGLSKSFLVKQDDAKGELYVGLKGASEELSKASSFFLQDDFGNTYTIIVTPYDIPSETVTLNPLKRMVNDPKLKNTPLLKKIKELVKAMANIRPEKFGVKKVNTPVSLWKEAKITHLDSYQGDEVIGDRYLLKNVDSKEMILEEAEFTNFGKNTLAVAIEEYKLLPDESTLVYIVRRK